jgi:hypothetical protein
VPVEVVSGAAPNTGDFDPYNVRIPPQPAATGAAAATPLDSAALLPRFRPRAAKDANAKHCYVCLSLIEPPKEM